MTRRHTHEELKHLANDLDRKELPAAGVDVAVAVDALDGAFASAFIQALRPR